MVKILTDFAVASYLRDYFGNCTNLHENKLCPDFLAAGCLGSRRIAVDFQNLRQKTIDIVKKLNRKHMKSHTLNNIDYTAENSTKHIFEELIKGLASVNKFVKELFVGKKSQIFCCL